MKSVWFAAGAATGYVLGARAGRQRYEQIVSMTKRVAGDPRVQRGAKKAGSQAVSAAGTAGAAVAHTTAEGVTKAVDKAVDTVRRDKDQPDVVVTGNGHATQRVPGSPPEGATRL